MSSVNESLRSTGLTFRASATSCLCAASISPQLTLWSEDFHVNPSALPESGADTTTSDGSGLSSSGWCEKCDPIGSSLRTCLLSELSGPTASSLIWSKRATPLGRSWWVLTTSERPTDASASSSWPTASARDWKDTPGMARESTNADGSTRNRVDQLPRAVFAAPSSWPTPTAETYGTANNWCPGDGREAYATKGRPSLEGMARLLTWPTPRAEDSESTGAHGARIDTLTAATRVTGNWPTPTAGDADASGNRNLAGSKAHAGTSLTDAVLGGQRPRGPLDPASSSTDGSRPGSWPTPKASNGGPESGARKKELGRLTSGGGDLQSAVGHSPAAKLNPDWVSVLMGFPADWLHGIDVPVSKPSATRSSRPSRKRSGGQS